MLARDLPSKPSIKCRARIDLATLQVIYWCLGIFTALSYCAASVGIVDQVLRRVLAVVVVIIFL